MTTYLSRPVPVDAYRWLGHDGGPVPAYVARWEVAVDEHGVDARCGRPWRDHAITTDAAHRPVCLGQWAVRAAGGDVRVLDDVDFRESYQRAA